MTGEGGRHYFTSYISNGLKLTDTKEIAAILKSYSFDLKRIS